MGHPAGAVILAALEGTEPTTDELTYFHRAGIAGVTLFKRNVPSPLNHLKAVCKALQSGRTVPMLVAIDQEGGRVSRLPPPFPNLGPALHLAAGGHDQVARDQLYRYGAQV